MSKYAAIEDGIYKELSAEETTTVAHGTIQGYKEIKCLRAKVAELEAKNNRLTVQRDQSIEAVQALQAGRPLGAIVGAQTILAQAAALQQIKALVSWLHDSCRIIDIHDPGCPEDDTCECETARRINRALGGIDHET